MRINPRLLAVSALGTAAIVAGISGIVHALPAAAAEGDTQPSLEESFDYPDGGKTPGIKLLKGDGHFLLVGCDEGKTSTEVYTFGADKPFCFQIKGTTGWVTLELADVYGVRNYEDFGLNAKVSVEDKEKTVPVPEDDWAGVGVGAGEGPAVLLELRTTK